MRNGKKDKGKKPIEMKKKKDHEDEKEVEGIKMSAHMSMKGLSVGRAELGTRFLPVA